MTFRPTDEQNAIVEHAKLGQSNLLVEARAGAAKTSTLELVARALPEASGLAIAFNKSIATELGARLPANFEAKTMNGLGHRALGSYLGKRLILAKSKTYGLLKDAVEKLPKKEQDVAYEEFGQTLRIIGKAKQLGFVSGLARSAGVKPVLDEEEFLESIPEIPSDQQLELIRHVTAESWRQARTGLIDFDDQILCPAICSVTFDHFSHVMVDEAQDLSPLQHRIIGKIVRGGTRLIAVGDPCQAIYGFRGADEDSMSRLAARFDMETLHLTTCFRCAQSVVRAAQWRAPDMRWPEWAGEGTVRHLEEWAPESIPDGSAVLCRSNAPLFRMALRLLRAGRYPEFMGRDIVKNLVARMRKLGKPGDLRPVAEANVKGWLASEKTRNKDTGLTADIAECMMLFIGQAETLGAAIQLCEAIGNQTGQIKLATGHRAKGLEFPEVFFLDQHLCKPKGQDRNIKYVIQTRAQERLTYITTEGFVEAKEAVDEEIPAK